MTFYERLQRAMNVRPPDSWGTVQPATPNQIQLIAIMARELGQGAQEDRLALITAIAARPLTSTKDLSQPEARNVIDVLGLIDGALDPWAAVEFALAHPGSTT